jgi:hypothetical protein
MKYLISLLLLVSLNTSAQIVVIGDSISSQRDSWPQYLSDTYGYQIKLLAQNGRTAEAYEIPRDLTAESYPTWDSGFDTVVYWLGANDAAIDWAMRPGTFGSKFSIHRSTLHSKGFKTIFIVPPFRSEVDMTAIRRTIILSCLVISKMNCVVLDDIWEGETHPSNGLSALIADRLHNKLVEVRGE